jgi:hypothetical protein
MSELREEACAVGAVRGHLALLLVGEVGQGGGEIEGGLGQGDAEQEAQQAAHGTQTQRQHGQRGPGRCERADVTVQLPTDGRRGPPLSPVSPLAAERAG